MRIQITKKIEERFSNIEIQRGISDNLNNLIANTIAENEIVPSDVEELRVDGQKMRDRWANANNDILSGDQYMLMVMIQSLIHGQFDRGAVPFLVLNLAKECRAFKPEDFAGNPYYKNIKFDRQELGDFELCYQEFKPYELDIYNVPIRVNETVVDIPRVSCFTGTFKYPSICQKSINSTWMSVTPNEIFTMEAPINHAKGKVLTLGCGMGYFAYMAALKEDVESVTIVEREQSVIDLFEKLILPQFNSQENDQTISKIQIIKADAIEYMQNLEDGEYDYCFADIWIGIDGIEPYMKVKESCRKFKKTKMEYWIEDAFAYLLSAYGFIVMQEAMANAKGENASDMNSLLSSEEQKRNVEYMRKLYEGESITRPEHLDYYLDPKTILRMIQETDIIY